MQTNQITLLKFDILASIYAKPGHFIELCKRDFLQGKTPRVINIFVSGLERDKLIRKTKTGVYKAYRSKARKILNNHGYEV